MWWSVIIWQQPQWPELRVQLLYTPNPSKISHLELPAQENSLQKPPIIKHKEKEELKKEDQ